MDSTTAQRLALAWMRRKRWEADLTALAVVGKLGEAMGGKAEGKEAGSRGSVKGRSGKVIQKIPASQLMGMMGVRL